MEEAVMAIRMHGEELDARTDINTREFLKASHLVSSITGMGVQANKSIVGANAFAHSSGIHQDGVLKSRETYEIIDPADVGAGESRIVLTARSGHAALKHRLEELGYDFDSATLDAIYESFLKVADRKKEVYDEDLESLINEYGRTATAIYTLEAIQISCGVPLTPTATLTLRDDTGAVTTVAEYGTGPIDAAYRAVDKIVKVENDLSEFVVKAVTHGVDALGEVTIRITAGNGQVFTGRGADPDIIVSSTRAYLNALNRLLTAARARAADGVKEHALEEPAS
jgi:2-isopropylmalate synthase